MNQRHIAKHQFTRLSNVVPVASIGEHEDLVTIIRHFAYRYVDKIANLFAFTVGDQATWFITAVNDELFSMHTEVVKQPASCEVTFLGGEAAGFSNSPDAAKMSGNHLDADGLPVKALGNSVANESYVQSEGMCSLQIGISDRILPFELIVLLDCRHDFILGWNFLKASEAIIDCGRSVLTLDDVEVTSEDIVFKPLRVCVMKDCGLPAQHTL
ncbi:transposon Ty3-I Gag-Pol polyprotein [Trichonephila clavipes]|nr:transposon Ty3-I Gag-Pol polyprotein [Trichonephila clavipes]